MKRTLRDWQTDVKSPESAGSCTPSLERQFFLNVGEVRVISLGFSSEL